MSWDQIYGHDAIRQRFENAFRQDRMASTFLFVGPPGIGKRTFAMKLAQALLCPQRIQSQPGLALEPCGVCPSCKQLLKAEHPDLDWVQRPPDRNQIMLEQLIGDKSDRQGLCQRVGMKSFYGQGKVAILDDADDLRQEGANALLKTLEEPPPGSTIILIGTSEQRQLPTIRSRCQTMRFNPLSWQQVEQILVERELVMPPEVATRLAKLSGGSVQNALLLFGEEILDFRGRWIEQLASLHVSGGEFMKTLLAFVDQAGKDAPSKRRRMLQIAAWAAAFYRQVAFAFCQADFDDQQAELDPEMWQAAQNCAANWPGSAEDITLAIDRCFEAENQVQANAHTATLLESWLIDLNQIPRGHAASLPSLSTRSPLSF